MDFLRIKHLYVNRLSVRCPDFTFNFTTNQHHTESRRFFWSRTIQKMPHKLQDKRGQQQLGLFGSLPANGNDQQKLVNNSSHKICLRKVDVNAS